MENNAMIITQPLHPETKQWQDLNIRMKQGFDDKALYHCIIQIIEWSNATNGNNPQQVLDWLREKKFFNEHVYNPVV